jgi:hypothetical protein
MPYANSAGDDGQVQPQRKATIKYNRSPTRPLYIDDPEQIAVFFANVVTTPSDTPNDSVARNGDNSIRVFSAFRSVLPEVITPVG